MKKKSDGNTYQKCCAYLFSENEVKYSRNYISYQYLETPKGDLLFDTPYSILSAIHVRVYDSSGYEIGRSNPVTITEEVKKQCEEKKNRRKT